MATGRMATRPIGYKEIHIYIYIYSRVFDVCGPGLRPTQQMGTTWDKKIKKINYFAYDPWS